MDRRAAGIVANDVRQALSVGAKTGGDERERMLPTLERADTSGPTYRTTLLALSFIEISAY